MIRVCSIRVNRKYHWLMLPLLSFFLLFNVGLIWFNNASSKLCGHFARVWEMQLYECNSSTSNLSANSMLLREPLGTLDIEARSSYIVINNYIKALHTFSNNSTVTLCTQGSYEFLPHVSVLCERWQAPLSVAVYAPGQDFHSAITAISRLRQCGTKCIAVNVTWHMIFDSAHPPPGGIPLQPEQKVDCTSKATAQEPYREQKSLTYPINIARNVARLNSHTHYLFVSDIELYPSSNIVPRFLKMVSNETISSTPHVYVLPPFEMMKGLPVPRTKSELVKMMKKNKAVFFHKYSCDSCHSFPDRDRWMRVIPPEGTLNVFRITKGRRDWEPFYIGSANEPLFDERFTWEGKNNKISHTQVLCFLGYDMYILDNAFLMHSPGIKTRTIMEKDHKKRSKYLFHNQDLQNKLTRYLREKYPNQTHC